MWFGLLSTLFLWTGFDLIPTSYCRGHYEWMNFKGTSPLPKDAVNAGFDGGPLYVARVAHKGDLIPGKYSPRTTFAYIGYFGTEIVYSDFEILLSNDTAWKSSSGGAVPFEALVVGNRSYGEPLYMGRALMHGTVTPGRVDPMNRCVSIPYAGIEFKYHNYEVLILLK